ncbi:hypothetical protein BBBOND_0106280 [Babesia bigemina]|uniref:Uncharacterized protein n=1 Tax=Babesia bigemina TaxID=5866 RepID=A0A061D5Y4_BABBI|nr:hypothetical protein BBBOND_0106280 [Babesia bigemina]CDR94319.1 hypothetical protein BBBOND_0106280 [Babesia bigemina]|eukprot:XP_012766505.1 hypothetical protein BBBOND_0106280 [Babesia bigemina]
MLAQCCRLSRLRGGTPTPFWTTYVHSPGLRINVRYAYWPPPANKRSRLIELVDALIAVYLLVLTSVQLPSGKKFFVFRGKRDADGKLEPVVCFIDRYA